MSRSANLALIVVFLAVTVLPAAGTLAGFDGADPVAENREMAHLPPLEATWTSLSRFPSGLSMWFEDHFAFRAGLVRWDAAVRMFALKQSPSSDVLLGNDGWLFYADDGAIEDMTNASLLTSADIANWRDAIVRARDWSRHQGVAFVFAVVPDKHVIYPEQLVDGVRRIEPISRTDQIVAALNDLVLDVRPDLLAAKTRERIYHRTDSHWNERGAFIAYRRIIESVRLQNPAVPPAWLRSDFADESRLTPAGDLAGMLGLRRVLREERLLLTPLRPRLARVVEPPGVAPTAEEGRLVTEIRGSNLPRAVIIRDSFASPLVPFLSEHFSRAVYLWQKDFVPESVTGERPDVVIYELIGRRLYNFIPTPELIHN
jgi:hypothetical protein